ncbi:putative 20S rRNA accumulation protein 4 [Leucoagaricus sp. SymC.cos]|nr:putative 20S rRNA accumulation protein 4 [Leucoagaricus sp. SymC.cos]
MPTHTGDWSDSDDDDLAGVETSVLLGVPDGAVDDVRDITDVAVSRIGGHPAFLPSREPPFDSSLCKVCSSPMQLLLQIWCPFEDSPMDRALYVWGCARGACQKKDGSIRTWRGLRFNEKYAAKLEKKLAKKRERERARVEAAAAEQAKKAAPKVNPFSISASTTAASSNPFALGNQIFGGMPTSHAAPMPTPSAEEQEELSNEEDSGDESDTSEKSLLVVLASTTLDDSPWRNAPAYGPLYLSTVSEYLPPQPKPKLPANAQIIDPDNARNKNDPTWTSEAYENSLEIDNVFDRFAKRVAQESEQCLRYELKGTPLPFAKDQVFDKLFPIPTSNVTTVSKAAFSVSPQTKRTYSPSTALIPPCPSCNSSRVFECQLMPNLINILKTSPQDQPNDKKQTDEERKKVVEQALKSGDGMSWGTAMIFSCEKDCCLPDGASGKECWREEVVLVQWDT